MCLGENSANHAVHYINAQLTALWENSVQCSQHSGKNLKPTERVRYDFALREFHIGSNTRSKTTGEPELMFSATFDRPRIDFICNHEAVLYLTIKDGHFNRDFSKMDQPTFTPTRARNVPIKDLQLAFRLDFSINGITQSSAEIGNGSHLIQLLVLKMSTANLVSIVNIQNGKDPLAFYLKKYLEFLHQAGHHTLFSLPDFDDDNQQVQIEFSLLPHFVRNVEHDIAEVFGVTLESINNTISSKWLKSIMNVEDESADLSKNKDSTCLAEYRSTWTTIGDRKDIQFWVKFGAPKLKILCKREAILYFTVEEFVVFDGNDFTVAPKHTYKDWEIATIIDLVRKVEGTVTRVELDLKSIRVCEPLCVFEGLDLTLSWTTTLKATIFEFFQFHYSVILEKISFHIVYVNDEKQIRSPSPVPDPASNPTLSNPTGLPIIHPPKQMDTNPGDYDFLQVLTVEGIVEYFQTLWQSYKTRTEPYAQCLIKWSHDEDFSASFGAITMKFLSNGKAMVWFHLEEGYLTPQSFISKFTGKKCQFMDWSIAFEVDINIVEHDVVVKKSGSWFERFQESFAWKQHGNQASRTLNHLCLDFSTAKFVYDKSRFEGLQLGSRTAVAYVKSAVHYLTKYYFADVTSHGHHILYTTPVWRAGSKPTSMGLTSLSFQIYSKEIYTTENIDFSTAVLILLGMTGFRKLPKGSLEYSSDWVVRGKGSVSAGTVCLSRQVFLEERLLKVLGSINGTTTIVPNFCPASNDGKIAAIFTGSEESEWGLALSTFDQRLCSRKKLGKCDWKVNANKEESDYKWQYTDKWSYEHENSHDETRNGMYKVSCFTKNLLSFPSSHNGTLDVVLKGHVSIELVFKGHGRAWNTHLESDWASTLSMKSLAGGSGLSVEVIGDSQPQFKIVHSDVALEQLFDVVALHKLLNVELSGLASELRQSFGGVWEHCFQGTGGLSLCNPIFNKNGDIIFELRPYVPITQAPVMPRPAPATQERKKTTSWIKKVGSVVSGGGAKGEQKEAEKPKVIEPPPPVGEKVSEKMKATLDSLGKCPQNYSWTRIEGGYVCNGGGHHIWDKDLEKHVQSKSNGAATPTAPKPTA